MIHRRSTANLGRPIRFRELHLLTVTADHVFELPADALWGLIGDFGATGKWSGRPPEACVQTGEGIGALRTLTL